MKVRVIVRGQQVDISCGDGKQTFQWLASAVQERLKIFNTLRRELETDQFIVTEIRNTSDELINPKDRLYEHAGQAGLTVHATVETSFPVDDWENPVMNEWMEASYVASQAGQHWAKEIAVWRENLEQLKSSTPKGASVNLNTTLLAKKIQPQTSRLVKIGFDFTEADVEVAFNLDWQGLQWSWASLKDSQKSRIGDTLRKSYSLVCSLFNHFAGEGKVGQRYGMTLEELGHLLHFSKVIHWKHDDSQVEAIFFKTAPVELERQSGKDLWPLMTRGHLASALVAIALEQHPELAVDKAVEEVLQQLGAFWDEVTAKYLAYTCPDPALRQAYQSSFHLIKQAFHQRAQSDSKFGPRLPLADFQELMEETALVDRESEAICISSFGAAHMNPPAMRELHHMVFVEFIEALSRVALKTIENANGLTDAKRVRMTLNMVIELPAKPDRGRK